MRDDVGCGGLDEASVGGILHILPFQKIFCQVS